MNEKKINTDKLEKNRTLILQFSIFAVLLFVLMIFNISVENSNNDFDENYTGINLDFDTLNTNFAVKPPLPGIIKHARFPGGDSALYVYFKTKMKYPEKAAKQKIQGRVYVKFTVNRYGKTKNIKVIRKIHPLLDAEAVKLIKNMPDWQPAETKNGFTESEQVLPVVFLITNNY